MGSEGQFKPGRLRVGGPPPSRKASNAARTSHRMRPAGEREGTFALAPADRPGVSAPRRPESSHRRRATRSWVGLAPRKGFARPAPSGDLPIPYLSATGAAGTSHEISSRHARVWQRSPVQARRSRARLRLRPVRAIPSRSGRPPDPSLRSQRAPGQATHPTNPVAGDA